MRKYLCYDIYETEFAVEQDPERIKIIVARIVIFYTYVDIPYTYFPTSIAWFLSAFLLLSLHVEEHFTCFF